MSYKEEQFGWTIVGLMDFFIFLILVFYFLQIAAKPITLLLTIVFIVVAIIVILLFFRLSVIVDSDCIKIVYGIGLIRKKISLKDIASVRKTKSKWYNGWGIRYIKNGMLYNIHGFNAIELHFKNSKRRILIGVKANSKLETEIKKRIDNKK